MVSASLDLYLQPIADALGFDKPPCTNVSTNHHVFNGELQGRNCRGAEKVSRLQALLGDLASVEIYAYGDSNGDREMLEVANHPHFRLFHA